MSSSAQPVMAWTDRVRPVLWLAVLAVWLVGLFRQGLFFPMAQLVAGGALAVLSGSAVALSWGRLRGWRPGLADLGLGLIAAAYGASLFDAVRPDAAALQAALVLAGLALFAAIRSGAFGPAGAVAARLRLAVVAGAALVTLAGLLASVGIVRMSEPALGSMLTSTFTYHNSYAAFALVGLVLALSGLALDGPLWASAAMAALAAWLLIGLILSQSRGAWLVAPVSLAVWLLGLRGVSRARALLLLVACTAAAAVGTPWALSGLERHLPHHMVGALALSAVVAAVLSMGVDALWRRHARLAHQIAVAAAGVGTGAALVGGLVLRSRLAHAIPATLAARAASLSLHDASVSQRIEIFRIAYYLIRGEPLTGYGGGAWLDLYHNLSPTFFSANQTHSFVTQVLLEAGPLAGIGLILAVVGVAVALWRVRRSRTRLGAEAWGLGVGLFALVSHAAFDWDLSFLALATLAWMLTAACLTADVDTRHGGAAVQPGPDPVVARSAPGRVAVGAALAVAVVGTSACTALAVARSDLGTAQLALRAGHATQARQAARASLVLDPWSTAAYSAEAGATSALAAKVALLDHAASLSPEAPDPWAAYAEGLLALGDTSAALRAGTHALSAGPWDMLAATAVARAADAAIRQEGALARRGRRALAELQADIAEQGNSLVVPTGSRMAPAQSQAQLAAALGEGDVLTDAPATGAEALQLAAAAEPRLKPRLAPWLSKAAALLDDASLAAEAAAWARAQ